MASVSQAVSSGRHAPQQDGHQQRRRLVVGQAAVGNPVDEVINLGAVQDPAVPLMPYQVDCTHE